MGYLSEYEHDIFVSYAHSDQLNAWSKRLIEEVRGLVAMGLGLKEANQIGVWWDYKLCGHEPLTRQLTEKAEKSALLLVLMSEWYLESSWCRDEVDWFVNAVQQKRADRPVFVVRVRSTDHSKWPQVFKDERGHPLTGYDFVRDTDDNTLGLPKGYPLPEIATDSKEYYDALSKLASDMVGQLKTLGPAAKLNGSKELTQGAGSAEAPARQLHERVFLAAVPEDVDELRCQVADLLREKGCIVVPDANPRAVDEVREHAAEWISGCDKFVQVLGSMTGYWPHDETGFVMYQHSLAKQESKPIFVYRAPALEVSQVKKPEYREFLERIDQDDTGGLDSFVDRVVRPARRAEKTDAAHRSVFMMASERDDVLQREIRRLLDELHISVFPLPRAGTGVREVASVRDESSSFLDIIRRCGAILLINGNVKEEDRLWIDNRVADIEFDIQRKLGGHPPYAIVDAPPDPRLEASGKVSVFLGDSPTFRNELQSWLQKLSCPPAAFQERLT